MIPNDVFHYTKKETVLEHILFDRKIRLGQIGFTNDPRETKEWSFPLIHDVELKSKNMIAVLSEINNKAHDIGTQEWKVLCVSQHHPDFPATQDSPFLMGYCRPRMWAQYGDNHKGVCLRLNGPKLDKQLKKELGDKCKIYHGPIVYDDMRAITAAFSISIKSIKWV